VVKKDLVVIVCGGRLYDRRSVIFGTLDAIHRKHTIVVVKHGGCTGADALADEWARGVGVPVEVFKVEYKEKEKVAGALRNLKMAQSGADICLVFPGGVGTANMMKSANECKIPVINVDNSEF
jgi:hypothetical protein